MIHLASSLLLAPDAIYTTFSQLGLNHTPALLLLVFCQPARSMSGESIDGSW